MKLDKRRGKGSGCQWQWRRAVVKDQRFMNIVLCGPALSFHGEEAACVCMFELKPAPFRKQNKVICLLNV